MNPESLRQLIVSCRHSNQRTLGFPRDWSPGCIKNPESPGYYFTETGAWEFIASKLEANHPYTNLMLDKPQGAIALVMQIQLTANEPPLYVKVQIGKGNKAIGRSFHYSDYPRR